MKIRITFARAWAALLLLLFFAPCVRAQQEVQLSQYMFSGLTLNPALAGRYETFNAQLLYRMQWQGFDGAPRSQLGSVDGVLTQSNNMGWGLSVVGEQLGLMQTYGAYASYAYRIRLNELDDRLALGLAAGAAWERFGGINISTEGITGGEVYDEYDDILNADSRARPDFKVGAYYNYGKTIYAGLSASNLGTFIKRGAQDSLGYNPYVYLTGGYHYNANELWQISPSLLACYSLREPPLIDVNMAVTYNERAWLGVGMRFALPLNGSAPEATIYNALTLMAEVWVTPSIRIGYCYDLSIGRGVGNVQNGSHEISFGFTLARAVEVVTNPKNF